MKNYYHVTGPAGFTMHLRADEISLLVTLGLVKLDRTQVSTDQKSQINYYVPCPISKTAVDKLRS